MKRVGGGKTEAAACAGEFDDDRSTHAPIVDFLNRVTRRSGIETRSTSRRRPTARGSISPATGGAPRPSSRRAAEGTAARRGHGVRAQVTDEQRIFVDALEYRKGKDVELRQMAKLLAEKAKQTGLDQQSVRSIPTNAGSFISRLRRFPG